jgi:serine/threonine-protein kinase
MTDTSQPTAVDTPHGRDTALADADADNLLGVTLHDTYGIRRIVGEGGMGRVYEAHHTRIAGKRFAIKVLRAEMAYSPEVRTRFQREADAAASIAHPNVIAVNDFGYAPDGRPYIVYDYLDGIPLSELIFQKKHVEVGIAVYIARQVCKGLQAAHDKGVIHRDLKPENIYLLGPPERPDVKVLDFGLSRFMEATSSNNVTRTGVVMGTPAYMAPEQACGERVDHRADVYGVGTLLYAMMTGHSPFEEDSPQAIVLAVMSKEPTRPRVHAPWIPEELEIVMQRAMARVPGERYATMTELDAALSLFDVLPHPDSPAPKSNVRPQLLSRLGSMTDDVDVGSARGQVVLLLVSVLVLLLLGLVTALAGAPDLLGMSRPLSTAEFVLILLAVVGTVLTPLILFVRWMRRRLWNNSVRIVELVPRLRGPLVAAAAVYGVLALSGRAADGCGAQFGAPGLSPGLSGWMGWGPILFGVALIAATTAAIRRRLLDSNAGAFRRLIAGPVLLGGAAVAAISLIQFGVRLRTTVPVIAAKPEPAPTAATTTPGDPAPAPTRAAASVPVPAPAPPPAAASGALVIERAPPELVAQTIPKGVIALEELKERYPNDPAVLEPLAIAYSKQAGGELQALEVLEKLFVIAPNKVHDKELEKVVMKTAVGSGYLATRALDLMAQKMGRRGADLLYDLFVTSANLRVAARERLDQAKAKGHFSPALAVAYDLRTADGCDARNGMLDRAAKVGDERSIAILQMFGNRTKKGCGYKKRMPCPPPCSAQAAAFRKTASDIQKRMTAESKR